MSKKSKAKGQEKRLKEKRARKERMGSMYQKFRDLGKNTKSKRSKRKSSKAKRSINAVSHPNGRCGNSGCIECFGIKFRAFIKNGVPNGMPQWMFNRWVIEKSLTNT